MLAGHRQLEMGDGEKVVVGPGDLLLVEDTTGKSHATRAIENEETISFVIPLSNE
jgi:hypothetical protein